MKRIRRISARAIIYMKNMGMTILTFIKKVLTLMKNHKKKIIALFLVAIIVTTTTTASLFRIGIITPSANYYLWFFNNNKSDFELIVEYVRENDIHINVYENHFDDIEDDTVKAAAMKIMLLGCFDIIVGYKDSVTFLFCNLIPTVGEPLFIEYTSESSIKEKTEYPSVSYSYKYKPICDHWYYVYKTPGVQG